MCTMGTAPGSSVSTDLTRAQRIGMLQPARPETNSTRGRCSHGRRVRAVRGPRHPRAVSLAAPSRQQPGSSLTPGGGTPRNAAPRRASQTSSASRPRRRSTTRPEAIRLRTGGPSEVTPSTALTSRVSASRIASLPGCGRFETQSAQAAGRVRRRSVDGANRGIARRLPAQYTEGWVIRAATSSDRTSRR